MIEKVEMYAVVCDNCNETITSDDSIVAWTDEDTAYQHVEDECYRDGGKHYCNECHSFTDEDELILSNKRHKPQ